MVALLRDGRPRTRSELVALTGMSRSVVARRVDALLQAGWVTATGGSRSDGGRGPSRIAFDASTGAVLSVLLDTTSARLGVTDLSGRVLAERVVDLEGRDGPEEVLARVVALGRALLARSVGAGARLAGVGLGVPGPVERTTGRPLGPCPTPEWEGFDVAGRLRQDLGPVVAVDSAMNVAVLGERFTGFRGVENLVLVRVGDHIGCGIISGGVLWRGARGGAGDLGHVRVNGSDRVLCGCGSVGCLEAVAGGEAVAARLAARGHDVRTSRDVAALAREGDPDVLTELRVAGRHLGEALADVVGLLNPAVIVVGGALVDPALHLLAGVREVVYGRSSSLATRHLRIVPTGHSEGAGLVGAAVMVIEQLLDPGEVDRSLTWD